MKKFTLLAFSFLLIIGASAQLTLNQNSIKLPQTGTALPTDYSKSSLATVPYIETFAAGMPANYVLANLDGNTVYSGYATYFTNAWNVMTFTGFTSPAACSTSWYTPAGTSNDWMMTVGIQIPATGTYQIKWKAKASDASAPDGYIVYMTSTIAGAAPVTTDFSSPAIFTIAAENTTWTNRNYVIPGSFNGQTIYIAFRNNSTDMNILAIDDIEVTSYTAYTNEIEVTSTYADYDGMSYYEVVPLTQANTVDLAAVTLNNGSAAQTNVTLHASDVPNAITGTTVLASAAAAHVDTLIYTATLDNTTAKGYGFKMNVTQTQTDEVPANNTGDSLYLNTDPAIYARTLNYDSYLSSYSFGAGAPAITGMEYGCNYHFMTADQVDTICVFIYGASGTGTITGKLYDVNLGTGARTVVAQTAPYTPTGTPEFAMLPLTTFYPVTTVPAILTATVQMNLNVTTAPRDTIKILADSQFPGKSNQACAIYIKPAASFVWASTASVPLVALIVDNATGIKENYLSKDVFVYPNPVSNTLYVMNKIATSVEIYNLAGEVVASYKNQNIIDVTKLTQGTYLVKVVTAQKTITEKIEIIH